MSDAKVISITVNGEPRTVPAESSIADLLSVLSLNPKFLAVERNRDLVPRANHATCILSEADELEIVTLVGGG
ncbi:MAG: sulfur carrier protein ThiS [Planctomycetaceae bacterium]|nr:sulfur carrier protein ThiS [Planctomycetaceae bacterium]MCB9949970.1 sulfur carrier protein ThiS [Planctomycetaceae bacterium]